MVSRFRLTILVIAVLGAFSYLVFNFYTLQVSKGSYYLARAESQYRLAGFLEPHRGLIYLTDKDSNSIPAALNKSYPVIFAVPKEIDDVEEAVGIISPVIKLEEDVVRKALSNRNTLYKLLVKKASKEQVEEIKQINLKGIYVDEQEFRFYSLGELAAHLLGFIGPTKSDDLLAGRYGVERQFDNILRGTPGEVRGNKVSQSVRGKDIFLTIDRNIQGRAEEILEGLVGKYRAQGGTVIVQNPKTGDILALGNYPDFNPNEYSKSDVSRFLNPAIQAIYEPGSIFKVITMAAGLDSGKITPETTYNDAGQIILNGKVIKNWDLKAHGTLNMTQVIEGSVNTGSAFAAGKIGGDLFYNYLEKFGFTETTGIQLPEEIIGNIENIKKPREINLATASFGQGISVTPIGLLSAVSAIANNGVLMKPNIIKGNNPKKIRQAVSAKAASEVTAMMISAVDKAIIARIPSYKVAGKTGTAQVPNFKSGGYTEDVINTYIGFAPATNPRFVIFIKLDKPAGGPLAGLTVVPAFKELAQFILNYYNIPPDNL